MAWEEIKPRSGMRSATGLGVTVSWRHTGSSKSPALIVICNKALSAQLGWAAKSRVVIARDRVAGKLRMQAVAAGGFSVMIHKGFITQKVLLDGVTSEKRVAEPVDFEVQDGALILILPDWAAPERRGLAGAEKARQEAVARATTPPPPAGPRPPFTSITQRVADPGAGRRVG